MHAPDIHAKGWGRELWLHNADGYCFKILEFHEAARGSLHFHLRKHETWYVLSGRFEAVVVHRDATRTLFLMAPGDCLHLPAGTPHRLVCLEEGRIAEASTTHDDADVVRVETGDSQRAGAGRARGGAMARLPRRGREV